MTLSRPLPPNIYILGPSPRLFGTGQPASNINWGEGEGHKGARSRLFHSFSKGRRRGSKPWLKTPLPLSFHSLSPSFILAFHELRKGSPHYITPWFYFDAHVVVFRETPLVTFLDFFSVNFFYNIGLKKAKSKLVICIYDQKKMIFSHRWTFFWYIRIFSQILPSDDIHRSDLISSF